MNKLSLFISLIIISVCFCSCSKENKAKQLIKDELYETINDIESYSPVKYGDLDSLYNSYKNDTNYINNEKLYVYLNNIQEEAKNRFNSMKYDPEYLGSGGKWRIDVTAIAACIYFKDEMYNQIRDSIEKAFKPQFVGYKMIHKYRAKNSSGSTQLFEVDFCFDTTITSIITLPTLEKTKNDTDKLNKSFEDVILRTQNSSFGKYLPR